MRGGPQGGPFHPYVHRADQAVLFEQTKAETAMGRRWSAKSPSLGHLPIDLLFFVDHRLQVSTKT